MPPKYMQMDADVAEIVAFLVQTCFILFRCLQMAHLILYMLVNSRVFQVFVSLMFHEYLSSGYQLQN